MNPTLAGPTPGGAGAVTVGRRAFPFAPFLWFSGLLVVLFFPVIRLMVWEWATLEEMGHAFFVPLVVGFIVWKERDRILSQPVKPFWPAIVLVVWGFFQMICGFLGADYFIARTALLVTLAGVLWTTAGTAVLRSLLFPLLLLLFAVRLPLFVTQQITFPLQLFASTVASDLLNLIGIPVMRDGNILELPTQRLQVVEACSGIRSLFSLTFISLAYAYVFDRRKWMRPVLFVATIPIAIGTNAFRITLSGILSQVKPEWAEGGYHLFEGWIIFLVALAILMAFHRILCRFAGAPDA